MRTSAPGGGGCRRGAIVADRAPQPQARTGPDRIGRRNVFAATLLIYGVATGAAGLSTGLAMLIALRFVVGLGLGAELPVASTLVSEYAPTRIRGRVVVLLEAFWAVGWVLAALIGYIVVPASDDGWRWALALGAVPAVYAAAVRYGLPESVRFLERRGRYDEAESVVRRFEDSAGMAPTAAPAAPTATCTCGARRSTRSTAASTRCGPTS